MLQPPNERNGWANSVGMEVAGAASTSCCCRRDGSPRRLATWLAELGQPAISPLKTFLVIDRIEVNPARLAEGGNPIERRQIGVAEDDSDSSSLRCHERRRHAEILQDSVKLRGAPAAVEGLDWKKFIRCG